MKPPVVQVNSESCEVYTTQTTDADPASLQVPPRNYWRAEHDEKTKVSNATLYLCTAVFLVTSLQYNY